MMVEQSLTVGGGVFCIGEPMKCRSLSGQSNAKVRLYGAVGGGARST